MLNYSQGQVFPTCGMRTTSGTKKDCAVTLNSKFVLFFPKKGILVVRSKFKISLGGMHNFLCNLVVRSHQKVGKPWFNKQYTTYVIDLLLVIHLLS